MTERKALYCQHWTEGVSFHLAVADIAKYVNAYRARLPDAMPDEYSCPVGTPFKVHVSDSMYNMVEAATEEYGVMRWIGNYREDCARGDVTRA